MKFDLDTFLSICCKDSSPFYRSPYDFDPEIEKIENEAADYVKSCEDEEINVPCPRGNMTFDFSGTSISVINYCNTNLARALLVKRFNKGQFSFSYLLRGSDPKIKLEILRRHFKNGWLESKEEKTLIHAIFRGDPMFLPETENFYDQVYDLMIEYSYSVNYIVNWNDIIPDAVGSKSGLKICKCVEFAERSGQLTKEGAYIVLEGIPSLFKISPSHLKYIFDLCSRYVTLDQSLMCIPQLVRMCPRWEVLEDIADKFWELDSSREEYFLLNVACYITNIKHFKKILGKYMVDSQVKTQKSHYCKISGRNMNFLDLVIAYNTVECLKYVVQNNIVPIENNEIVFYVPEPDCMNGEEYPENFQNIDTKRILKHRYNIEWDDFVAGKFPEIGRAH